MTKTSGAFGRRAAQGHCMGAAAAAWRTRDGFGTLLLLWILVGLVEGQTIEFTSKPAGFSPIVSPAFRFEVFAGANGVNLCATQQCSFQCKVHKHRLPYLSFNPLTNFSPENCHPYWLKHPFSALGASGAQVLKLSLFSSSG